MKLSKQVLAAAAAVGIAAAGGSAFTASNTGTPDANVGQGASNDTGGYNITGVSYTLDTTATDGHGDHITKVTFSTTPLTTTGNLGNPATKARIRLVKTGDWSTTASCAVTTPGAST
ncbi:MAG: hypothetical protein JWN35_295, partial [Frankiales bacterium]|nr:hypothetical protein [Frankiales bacterium]